MSTAIPVRVALVDTTGMIDNDELEQVAGAMSEQVTADFAPIWHVRGTVGNYAGAIPAGTWQVQIVSDVGQGALGYHTDDQFNQPIAYVDYGNDWPQTASHELLEMLADPFGNRLHAARLPFALEADYEQFGLNYRSSRVHYLLEVCDPCEAQPYAVGGVHLSDFLLPAWYRTTPLACEGHYSMAGNCTQPRDVPDGGYVSFCNSDGEWFQVFNQGGALSVADLGKFNQADYQALREFTDSKAREFRS